MKTRILFGAICAFGAALLVTACSSQETKNAKGFALPDGDPEAGKQAFTDLRCTQCHALEGVDLPKPAVMGQNLIVLGGEVRQVKTQGDLVTAVINPQHSLAPQFQSTLKEQGVDPKEAKSPMPSFTHEMSVRQMIDIVAFLKGHYIKTSP